MNARRNTDVSKLRWLDYEHIPLAEAVAGPDAGANARSIVGQHLS
jgi:hypothetical protein